MTIQTDLFTHLKEFARINLKSVNFALSSAAPDAQPPFVEITLQRRERTRTTGVTSAIFISEFEIECWETNTVKAEEIATALIGLLQDYTGNLNDNTKVWSSRIFNEFGGSDSAAELFYSSFTVALSHN